MKKLDDYKHDRKKPNMKLTSINLEKRQLRFIKEKNLNLSKLVRDYINDIMENFKNKE